MKEKKTRLIGLLFSVLLLLTAILPPAEAQAAKTPTRKPVKISCIKSGSVLYVGSRKALSAKAGTKSSLTYKVSNKSLASVSKNGIVTARRAGTVKVTITAAPKSRKFKKTSRTISIKILPAKPAPAAKRTGSYVTVSVKAAKGASGYQYQYAPDKSFRKAKTKATSARSYKFNPGKGACYVRVRSFAKVGKGRYYSPWSKAIRVTAQAAQKPAATPTAKPTGTPKPTVTPKPTTIPKPTVKPTVTPKPTVKPTVTPAIKASQISLSSESLSFNGARGDQQQLTASVFPENAANKNVQWESSSEIVAQVDENGLVTAVWNGSCTITCRAMDGSGASASCKVTVNIPIKVSSMSMLSNSTLKAKGATVPYSVDVYPENATNKSVLWESSDSSIATVDANGLVTAVGNGSCTITCTAADGSGVSSSCKVTVKYPVPIERIELSMPPYTFDESDGKKKERTFQLGVKIYPENATNKNVTWDSTDSDVAWVSNLRERNGLITAENNGTCTITCTSDENPEISASLTVTVALMPSFSGHVISADKFPEYADINDVWFSVENYECMLDDREAGLDYDSFVQKRTESYVTNGIQYKTLRSYCYKDGTFTITAHWKDIILGTRTFTSTYDTDYWNYIAWKNSVKAELWTDDMTDRQKLDAICSYIHDNFTYRSQKGEDTNRLYAYLEMKCDCVGAADMIGDFAYDLGLSVRYFSHTTNQSYEYLSLAIRGNHVYNEVLIGDEWLYYDATPGSFWIPSK